jgi:hypothetical protein
MTSYEGFFSDYRTQRDFPALDHSEAIGDAIVEGAKASESWDVGIDVMIRAANKWMV